MDQLIPVEAMPLAHSHGERTAIMSNGVRGEIEATCVDGRLRVINPIEVTVTNDLPAIDGWAYAIAVHPNHHSAAIGGINGQIRRIENLFARETKIETR